MIMTAPHFASIPREMIAAACDWLTRLLNETSAGANQGGAERDITASIGSPATVLTLPPSGEPTRDALITERPVFLTSQTVMFGIVTEPAHRDIQRGAIVFVNAGADYHIGPSGIYVNLARRWARDGFLVLRVDLAGLGDSATRLHRPDNEVFPAGAVDDIRAAIEWIRSEYGVDNITLGGLCSGAYHALRAAVAAIPVKRIIMVNPETYFWDEGMSINDMQVVELIRSPVRRGAQIFSVAVCKRFLSGQIDVRYILIRNARRLWLALESRCRDLARRLHIRLPRDLGLQIEEIAGRGVRIVFVFSRGEPGIDLLKLQAGISLARLGDRCRIHIIDNADHVFSKFNSRVELERKLSNELFALEDLSGAEALSL
jgi:pimeloyl-ACP methyl ester carboxylesterase